MGIFDNPLFDYNGDGKVDVCEFAMGMTLMEEIDEATKELENKDKEDNFISNIYDE